MAQSNNQDLSQLESLIIRLESKLFDPETRLSKKDIDKLLYDDFSEIQSTGRCYFKDEALSRLPQESPPKIKADSFKVKWLEEDLALLTYRSTYTRSHSATIYSLRSSIWQKDGASWKMRFHQGTPCSKFDIDG